MTDEHAGHQKIGCWKSRVVLDEVWVTFAIGIHEAADDAKAGALGVFVFTVAGAGSVGDDAFDVPFVGVEKEADKGLFVIGIAAGVGLDHDAEAFGGVSVERKGRGEK